MIYQLEGLRPQLPEAHDYWVAPNAAVLGDVVLEKGVGVWFSATLRGDCARLIVGEDSNIQDGCVLHADPGRPLTVGARVTVGHLAMLHGCDVEDEVLIGIGAVILNGARIRSGSMVGARALVLEGMNFPPNSLILGAPAKVARQLTAIEREAIRTSAVHYRDNARRFAATLNPADAAGRAPQPSHDCASLNEAN